MVIDILQIMIDQESCDEFFVEAFLTLCSLIKCQINRQNKLMRSSTSICKILEMSSIFFTLLQHLLSTRQSICCLYVKLS